MASPERPKCEVLSAEQADELKRAERARLMAMPPDEAQAAVESILHPRLWKIADPRQLAWPGDLADDLAGESDEDPAEG